MARNTFSDPANVRPDYDWQINHKEEEEQGKSRGIEKTANSGNTGFIRQQSDSDGLVLRYTGAILHKAQLEEMLAWYDLCDEQSIYFEDFAGDRYEVIIADFKAVRHRTIRNPRDYANAPLWYWTYEIAMEVLNVLEGSWENVTT